MGASSYVRPGPKKLLIMISSMCFYRRVNAVEYIYIRDYVNTTYETIAFQATSDFLLNSVEEAHI